VQLVSKIFNLCGHDPPMSQTDRQTNGQTICDSKTTLCTVVHRAVKTAELQLTKMLCGWWWLISTQLWTMY